MKYVVGWVHLVFCMVSLAATPIDGLYTSVLGGYTYMPPNINQTSDNATLNSARYQNGYDVGGEIGYKSNPMRYAGEISYLKTNINQCYLNDTLQTTPSGYGQALIGMANIYYDVPNMNPILQPFLGVGIGYGWMQATLRAEGPTLTTNFSAENSTFAYQGMAGITYNFAENYALSLWYRYLGTTRLSQFGEIFQAHTANASATYRFDGNNYK